jgi:transcriptional regulator with XRE-family HTH domain
MESNINQRTIKILKDSGLSHSHFADKIGVSKQLISTWKNNSQAVTPKNIVRIIEIFPKVDARWLITGEKSQEINTKNLEEQISKDIESRYRELIEAKDETIQILRDYLDHLKANFLQ